MTRSSHPGPDPLSRQHFTPTSYAAPSRGIIYTPPTTTSSSIHTDHATISSSRPRSIAPRFDLEHRSMHSEQASLAGYPTNNTPGVGPARSRVTIGPSQPNTRMAPPPIAQKHPSQNYGGFTSPDHRLEIRPAHPPQNHAAFPPPSRRPAMSQTQYQGNHHNDPPFQTHDRTPSPPFQMKRWLAEERQPVSSALSDFERSFPSPTPQAGPSTAGHRNEHRLPSAGRQNRYQDQALSHMGRGLDLGDEEYRS